MNNLNSNEQGVRIESKETMEVLVSSLDNLSSLLNEAMRLSSELANQLNNLAKDHVSTPPDFLMLSGKANQLYSLIDDCVCHF